VVVRNDGDGALTVMGLSVDPEGSAFSLAPNPDSPVRSLPASLGQRLEDRLILDVTFAPIGPGPASAGLVVRTDDPLRGEARLTLEGTGLNPR